MSQTQTAVAESSPAAQATESPSFELPRSGTPEYAQWRMDGTVPEKPKSADPAPAPATPADAGESPAPPKQEIGKPKTEKRFQELLSERNRLKQELEALKGTAATEPQPKPVQQPQQQQYTRPKPTVTGNGPDGKPYADYEAFIEDLSDWKAEQRIAQQERQNQEKTAMKTLSEKVDSARSRYGAEKVDEIIFPTGTAIRDNPRIPLVIKTVIADSDIFPDLLFALGSDPKALQDFVNLAATNPGKAIRYVTNVERLTEAELKGNTSTVPRGTDGKFAAAPAAPAKRGPETAPSPPLEIGRRGPMPADESERAVSDALKGDPNAFRRFREAENRRDLARRRGA